MLGFRGCRLAVAFPEIAEMQARAIFEGAVAAKKKTGKVVTPEVMVPLVIAKSELDIVKAAIDRMHAAVEQETGEKGALHRRHHDRAPPAPACAPPKSPNRRNSSRSAPTT